jgi:hypothetical protein
MEYVDKNGHKLGMVLTVTVYCALCGKHELVNERDLTAEEYTRILTTLTDVIISIGEVRNG